MENKKDYFKEGVEYTKPSYEDFDYNTYDVNPVAESTLNVVATILLIIGIIVGVLIALVNVASGETYFMIYGLVAGAIAFVFVGLLPWACIKVIVNMSRNLHAIREELHEMKNMR